MNSSAAERPGQGRTLAILAALGGVIGLLAGLYVLIGTTGISGLRLVLALVVVAGSIAELAFAYGTASRAAWATRPALQAIGFAAAIALLLVGFFVVLTIPVRVTSGPVGEPVPSLSAGQS